MVRIALFIFSIILVGKEASASFSLPSQFFGIKRISDEFRLPIKNKLLQLRQNFIETNYKGGTRFTANSETNCPLKTVVPALSPIVKYEYRLKTQKLNNKTITYENRFLKGCDQSQTLVEKIKVVGNKTYFSSNIDILSGNYDFSMTDGKEELDYRMFDGFGEQVIRLYSKIENNQRISNFFLGPEKLMQIIYKKMKGKLEVRFRFYPITFAMDRNGSKFKMSIPARYEGYYKGIIYDSGAIEYFNEKGIQISLADFQKRFGLEGVSYIMNSILIELPETKFVNSGNQSARLIEELRNAQNWLIQGGPAQLNLVRNLVEEYLKASQNGLLVDKRPNDQ